jgi:hypothetical protein
MSLKGWTLLEQIAYNSLTHETLAHGSLDFLETMNGNVLAQLALYADES